MRATLRMLIDKVLTNLGVSTVDVEIKPSDIIQALSDALDTYNRYVPGRSWENLDVVSTVDRYVINKRNIIGILDVQFLSDFRVYAETEAVPIFTTRIAEIQQWHLRRKDAAKVLSTEPVWCAEWEIPPTVPGQPAPTKREWVLYISIPVSLYYRCSYQYAWGREPSDDPFYGIPSIPINHYDWVEEYTLACTKVILGRILDKFQGLPSPANTGLDGGVLRSEGETRKRELQAEILSWKEQPAPIIA